MDDWSLASLIGQFRIVALVDDEKHDGTWAEVERHTIPDSQSRMAGKRVVETVLLDRVHPYCCATYSTPSSFRVGPQIAV